MGIPRVTASASGIDECVVCGQARAVADGGKFCRDSLLHVNFGSFLAELEVLKKAEVGADSPVCRQCAHLVVSVDRAQSIVDESMSLLRERRSLRVERTKNSAPRTGKKSVRPNSSTKCGADASASSDPSHQKLQKLKIVKKPKSRTSSVGETSSNAKPHPKKKPAKRQGFKFSVFKFGERSRHVVEGFGFKKVRGPDDGCTALGCNYKGPPFCGVTGYVRGNRFYYRDGHSRLGHKHGPPGDLKRLQVAAAKESGGGGKGRKPLSAVAKAGGPVGGRAVAAESKKSFSSSSTRDECGRRFVDARAVAIHRHAAHRTPSKSSNLSVKTTVDQKKLRCFYCPRYFQAGAGRASHQRFAHASVAKPIPGGKKRGWKLVLKKPDASSPSEPGTSGEGGPATEENGGPVAAAAASPEPEPEAAVADGVAGVDDDLLLDDGPDSPMVPNFFCEHCDCKFYTPFALDDHTTREHRGSGAVEDGDDVDVYGDVGGDGGNVDDESSSNASKEGRPLYSYPCAVCSDVFSVKRLRIEHALKEHPEACRCCGESFLIYEEEPQSPGTCDLCRVRVPHLNAHKVWKHKPKLCGECGAVFATQGAFATHKILKHEDGIDLA